MGAQSKVRRIGGAGRRGGAALLVTLLLAAVLTVLPAPTPAAAAIPLPPACTYDDMGLVEAPFACLHPVGTVNGVQHQAPIDVYPTISDNGDGTVTIVGEASLPKSRPPCIAAPPLFQLFESAPCGAGPGPLQQYIDELPAGSVWETGGYWRYRQGETSKVLVDEGNWSAFGLRSYFTTSTSIRFEMTRTTSSVPVDELWILDASESLYDTIFPLSGPAGAISYPVIFHLPSQQAQSQPVASFTATPEPGVPSDVRFASTSTDPAGGALTATWDFGDGQTGAGATTTHRYAKPGTYDVTLTVRNPGGNQATATQQVTVAAPSLAVDVTPPAADQLVDDAFTTTVTVSAGPGVGPLRGLTFSGGAGSGSSPPVLTWDSASGLAAVGAPTPSAVAPFDLAPGASKEFTVSLEGSKAGTIALRSTVGGADDAGRAVTASGSSDVVIKGAPAATVTIEAPTPTLEVGEESTVTVRLATGDGIGNLEQLRFAAADALASDDEAVLEVLGPLTPVVPAGGLTMGPNQQRTFTAKVKGTKAGAAKVSARVTGRTEAGAAVAADAAPVTINVQDPGLELTVALDDDSFTIDEDAEGPKEQTRTITVTVENTSEDDVTDVSLLSFIVSWQEGLPFTRLSPNAVAKVVDGPDAIDGLDLGDLAAGEKITREFDLQVLDDGHLALSSTVTWKRGQSSQLAVAEQTFEAKPKYLLSFELEADASVDDNPADPWNTPDAVQAGRSFLVTGTIENLTNDQRVVATVPVTDRLGVSAANLRDLALADPAPGTPPEAMPLRDVLDPGDSTAVVGTPVAMPSPTFQGARTDVEVTWTPSGRAQLQDDEDLLTDVTRDQVLVEEGKDRAVVPVVWRPDPAPMGLSEFYALYTLSFLDSTIAYWYGIGSAAGQGIDAFRKVTDEAWLGISGDPAAQELWRQRYTGAWASFVSTLELARDTISALTPAEKALIAESVSNPLLGYLRLGRWLATSEDTEAARQAIGQAVAKTYADLTSLGDLPPEQLAERLGQGSGQVFGDVTLGMVTDSVLAQLLTKMRFGKNLRAAQDYVDAQAAAATSSGLKIEKGLKGIPASAALTDEVLAVGLGIRRSEKAQIQAVAKRFNVQIMARSRGAGAIDLLDAGKARLKPFGIDAKNVSDIDVQMLGFPREHLDTVVLKKPKAWDDIVADPTYQGLAREERAQVAARWQTRAKEWAGGGTLKESSPGSWVVDTPIPDAIGSERQKFLTAAQNGSFDLQFPTQGNWEEAWSATKGNPAGLPLGTARADFVLDELDGGVLRPRMNAAVGGQPLPITGDVDLVAILNPDGTFPSVDKIVAAYAELAKPPLGMQHPATWSFQYEKKSMDLLLDHSLGGITQEPLAVFDPVGSITAGLFDPKLSLVPTDRKANALVLIKVAGGTKLPSNAYGLGAVAPIVVESQAPQTSYYLPDQWRQSAERGVTYDRTAPPTQQGSIDELQQYGSGGAPTGNGTRTAAAQRAAGGWVPWSPPAAGPLRIAPQTAITDTTVGGERTVAVLDLGVLFEASGATSQAWFAPGDQVGLALGTPQEWVGTVSAATGSSITFADPVPEGLLKGTALHLLAAAPEPEPTPTTPTTPSTPTTPTDPTPADPTDPAGPGAGPAASDGEQTPADCSGELVRTGTEAWTLVVFGLGAVIVGFALVRANRRTRRLASG
jgi:PKD repeat protein